MRLSNPSNSMWILIGAVIAITGTARSAYFVYKEGQDSQKQADRIDNTVQSTDSRVKSLNEQISQQEKQIESLKEGLLLAQQKTIEEMEKASLAQKQMIDYTTGGDSFPYVYFSDWVGQIGTVVIVNTNPKNHSRNPLQKITVSIINSSVFLNLLSVEKKTPREIRYESTVLRTTLDWLSPHTSSEVGTIDVGDYSGGGGEKKFNIIIEANGKHYFEQIVVRKKFGKFYFGLSLRDSENKTLRITYQPGFLDINEDQYNFPNRIFGKFNVDESGNLVAR